MFLGADREMNVATVNNQRFLFFAQTRAFGKLNVHYLCKEMDMRAILEGSCVPLFSFSAASCASMPAASCACRCQMLCEVAPVHLSLSCTYIYCVRSRLLGVCMEVPPPRMLGWAKIPCDTSDTIIRDACLHPVRCVTSDVNVLRARYLLARKRAVNRCQVTQ